ncbi:7-dehydrocholesterol reductase [Babesia caballi]|uniref:7-dehydrocholesterol reductase n=1 Tax=Babesia caballi TaxID=5871 RepID=A0AAV4LQ79_BABCB|nr:7-dehydrocholesterol reductase [Babesia caballi]
MEYELYVLCNVLGTAAAVLIIFKGGLKIKGKVIKKNKKIVKIETTKPKDHIVIEKPHVERKIEPTDGVNTKVHQVTTTEALTPSENSFRIAQIKRTAKKVESLLKETHRERVEKFNQKLSKLSEHFDIPKVGPG